MYNNEPFFQDVYDQNGELMGVWISASLWHQIKPQVEPAVHKALNTSSGPDRSQDIQEPMDDWELLKKYWDFQYAVDTDVFCENCGNTTENWEQDHPRKFYLKAASLGGLVTFQCAQCSARILKKHFKDSIKVELLPFLK